MRGTGSRATEHVTATHCPYCALQCGMNVTSGTGRAGRVGERGLPRQQGRPVREGLDGARDARASGTAADAAHPHAPRDRSNPRRWDDALDLIAQRFGEIADALRAGRRRRVRRRRAHEREVVPARQVRARRARHLEHRLQRPVLHVVGRGRVDNGVRPRSRTAVSARRTSRRPPSSCLPAPTSPRRCRRSCSDFEAQQARGGTLIVVDPRRTPTAARADLHLAVRPGTDAALANGILHVLIRDNLIDDAFIADRTDGFEEVRRIASIYWPQRVEEITGVPEAAIVDAARRSWHRRASR